MAVKSKIDVILNDENGTPRAKMILNKDGPELAMANENGKPTWRAP